MLINPNFKIVLIVFYMLLVSCSASEKNENQFKQVLIQKEAKTKLHLMGHWQGEGKKELLVRELAREFGLLNQDIELKLQFPQEMFHTEENFYPLLIDSISKMVQTDTWPYDMFVCGPYIYREVGVKLNDPNWGQKYLVDFSSEPWFINAHKNSVFEKNTYKDLTGGIAPGAYLEGGWNILFASSEVEKKLGIEIKSLDMEIDDFITYAKAVFEYNQSHSDKITFYSLIRGNPAYDFLFWQLAMSALGKDQADNREEALNALQQAYKALEKLAPYKPLEQNDKYQNDLQLNADKSLFIFYYSYISLLWEKSNPQGEKAMHPCELPSLKGKKASRYPGQYSVVFAVPKQSKNLEAAKKLMNFMSTTEAADKWVAYSKCPSGLKNGISYSDFGKDKFGKFAQHIKQKYNDRLNEENLSLLLFNTQKTIYFNVESVLNGQMTADEAYNNLLGQIKGI